MNRCRSHHRPDPVVGDPVRGPLDALDVVLLATNGGRRREAMAAGLSAERLPHSMFLLHGLGHEALEAGLELALDHWPAGLPASVFLGCGRGGEEPVVGPEEAACWDRMAAMCAQVGVELLDWFVVGGGVAASVPELMDRPRGW